MRPAGLAAVAAVVLGGCGSTPPTSVAPTVAATAAVTPMASAPLASTRAPVRVDESLLAHLPEEIAGVPLEFSPDASAEAARSLELAGHGESVAFAVAGGVPLPDLAIVTVVGLRGDGLDEAAYRDLRDTYDAEVCERWGGVAGNAEAEIDGRRVHIATCAEEGRTYHTLLEASNALVSVYAAGEKRLGEQLVRELRDP